MVGLYLNWSCKECGTVMHDNVGIAPIYKVNGESNFVEMVCDTCGHTYFVNTNNPNKVVESERATVESLGVCCF